MKDRTTGAASAGRDHITSTLREARSGLDNLLNNETALSNIERAASAIIGAFERKRRLYSCGNGGSMCDAMHLAEELTGRYRKNRPALPAIAISDSSHLSCVANDFGYDEVFSRFVEGQGQEGDCLVAISTSGSSRNIIRAARAAKALEMKVIALTGKPGSELESIADICICTPAGRYADRVQELHIKVVHIFIELIERHFFPENYSTET